MDKQHEDMDMARGREICKRRIGMRNGHAKWTCCMDKQHGHVEFSFFMFSSIWGLFSCSRSFYCSCNMFMTNVREKCSCSEKMQRIHTAGHAAWRRRYRAWIWSLDMQHCHGIDMKKMNMDDGHAVWTSSMETLTCSMTTRHGYEIGACSMDMQDGTWSCNMNKLYGCSAWTCSMIMDMQHRHAAWKWSMEKKQHGQEVWTSSIHM